MDDRQALVGKRILMLRAGGSGNDYVETLNAHGASASSTSVLRIEQATDNGSLDDALTRIDAYDWVVFTSANTVQVVERQFARLRIDPGRIQPRHVAVIGPATLRAIQKLGWVVTLVPARNSGAGLLEALIAVTKQGPVGRPTVLLPQSDRADNSLKLGLTRAGYDVTWIVAYRTVIDDHAAQAAAHAIKSGRVDVVVFSSPSTVEAIAKRLSCGITSSAVVCIGERTARACAEVGMSIAAVCREPTPSGLLAAIRGLPASGLTVGDS